MSGREDDGRDTVLARLRRRGLLPRRSLGQHFLHDPRILAEIAEAASLRPEDAVLEVGTGPGTLTRELASRAGRVLTVELDERILEFAREELSAHPNVAFFAGDALAGKGQINPALVSELERLGPFKLVSNLPYSVATALLLDLFASGLPLRLAVATIQRELAERLSAPPGTHQYGPATAMLSFWATLELVRKLPPGAFWPPPRVSSEVIRVTPRPTPLAPREVYPAYGAWVHRLFSHRRKQLGGLLREALGEGGPGGEGRAVEALEILGLEAARRPEEVSPEGFVRLAERHPTFDFDTSRNQH